MSQFIPMKTPAKDDSFPSATRWIWSDGNASDAWLMFRRSVVLPADCHAASLRITASFHYLLYVNGTLVTRGSARSMSVGGVPTPASWTSRARRRRNAIGKREGDNDEIRH
jgi:hypothetical protein